jgi:NAD(P)-dependent dehydrogenase (short-subunit alcohol dehydrogenase family)
MTLNLDLSGKSAICTGATSGIGRAAAVALAAAGAGVVAVGRDAGRLAETVAEIEAAGGRVVPARFDLLHDDAPAGIVATAVEAFGHVDVLASCAGVYDSGMVGDPELDGVGIIDRQWALNARAPFRLSEAVLPHMGQGGSVVFLSSTMARFGIGYGAGYSMSKAGVEALMRVMAVELGPRGIRVNAISPGWVVTPMNEQARQDPAIERFAIAATPVGRLGTPEDLAAVIVFLASDAAAYVHGTVVCAEGGYPALPMSMLESA